MQSNSKALRTSIVNNIITFVRKFGLPDKLSGFMIKSLHFHAPWYFLIFVTQVPKHLAVLSLIPIIIGAILFVYLNGCFISIIEYKLSGDDLNIIDPILIMLDVEVNNDNRYSYTLMVGFIYLVTLILILAARGYFTTAKVSDT